MPTSSLLLTVVKTCTAVKKNSRLMCLFYTPVILESVTPVASMSQDFFSPLDAAECASVHPRLKPHA